MSALLSTGRPCTPIGAGPSPRTATTGTSTRAATRAAATCSTSPAASAAARAGSALPSSAAEGLGGEGAAQPGDAGRVGGVRPLGLGHGRPATSSACSRVNAPAYRALPTIAPSTPVRHEAAQGLEVRQARDAPAGDDGPVGARADLAQQVDVGAAERAVLGDVRDDVAGAAVGVQAGERLPEVAALLRPAAGGEGGAAHVQPDGDAVAVRGDRPAGSSPGSSSAAVPRLTRAHPVARAASRLASSRIPPLSSTRTSRVPTTRREQLGVGAAAERGVEVDEVDPLGAGGLPAERGLQRVAVRRSRCRPRPGRGGRRGRRRRRRRAGARGGGSSPREASRREEAPGRRPGGLRGRRARRGRRAGCGGGPASSIPCRDGEPEHPVEERTAPGSAEEQEARPRRRPRPNTTADGRPNGRSGGRKDDDEQRPDQRRRGERRRAATARTAAAASRPRSRRPARRAGRRSRGRAGGRGRSRSSGGARAGRRRPAGARRSGRGRSSGRGERRGRRRGAAAASRSARRRARSLLTPRGPGSP